MLLLAPRFLASQERGAIALGEAVLGLGVNMRVLMIGAHPDDEDTNLIAWLSRGRQVTTAYLSLTRGDGGQNLIGNELGEALGVIRTQELVAARRIDRGIQYFTRAFDFGFSKDTVDVYAHWPKDSILGDVVKVVRTFRPHVIVAVFSGTPRDGHGQHQVSGLLAREAYDVSGDTTRFPTGRYGKPWTVPKFYRAARGNAEGSTLRMDVGEYSPLIGRSYAQIAGESRSEHKSQGFGALQRLGPVNNFLRREASRVNAAAPASGERSMFDGIDTSWNRFRRLVPEGVPQRILDSLPAAFAAARAAYDPLQPRKLVEPLGRLSDYFDALINASLCPQQGGRPCDDIRPDVWAGRDADYELSLQVAAGRAQRALHYASGVTLEALAEREVYPAGTPFKVVLSLYNNGADTVRVGSATIYGNIEALVRDRGGRSRQSRLIPPGGFIRDTLEAVLDSVSQPAWLRRGRDRGMFRSAEVDAAENEGLPPPMVFAVMDIAPPADVLGMGTMLNGIDQVVFRAVDAVRGEVRHDVVAAPRVSVTLAHAVQYAVANVAFDREVAVDLRSADPEPRDVQVSLSLPAGLTADSATRTVRLGGYDARASAVFRVRGRIPAGEHRIRAVARSNGESFSTGYQLIDYEHIRRQRIYRPAEIRLSVVDARVPANLRVAYVSGVSDNVAPALAQLGVPVTVIPVGDLARVSLSGYTTLVVGPRAYEAHPQIVAANERILDFARRGGTVVMQYGQYEMTQPGIMPYPITINRPHDRVTHEDAPVVFLEPTARELTTPNRITAADFEGWVQERGLYMPRTFDSRYRPLLGMNDPGEQQNRGAILVAPVGQGRYIYTTLAFFRQLPAGVPGAARLFVNLLSAGTPASRSTP